MRTAAIRSSPAARNAAIVITGVDFGFAQFDGEFSSSGSAYAGGGGLRMSW